MAEDVYCATIDGKLVCIPAESPEHAANLIGLDGVAFQAATEEQAREWDGVAESALNELDVEMLLSFVVRAQRDQAGQFRRYRERGRRIPSAAVNRAIHIAELRGKLEDYEAPGGEA